MRASCAASLLLISHGARSASPAVTLLARSSSSSGLPRVRRLSLASASAEHSAPPFLLASLLPRSETIRRWRAESQVESETPITRVFAQTQAVPPSFETLLKLYTNATQLSPSDHRFNDAILLGDEGLERIISDLTNASAVLDLLAARQMLAELAQGSCPLSEQLQKLAIKKLAELSLSADEATRCLRLLIHFERQPRASLLLQLEDQALTDLQQKALENTKIATSALHLFAAFSLYRHRFQLQSNSETFLLRHLKKVDYQERSDIFALLEALAQRGGRADDVLSFLERRALHAIPSFTGADLVRYFQLVEKIRAPYTPQLDFLDAFYLQVHSKLDQLSLSDIESLMNFYLQLFHWKPSVFHLRELEKHILTVAKQHASRETLPRTSLIFEQCSIRPAWIWGPR